MTVTLEHKDIEVKNDSYAQVAVDLVWDKHDGMMVREIYNGNVKVLGRFNHVQDEHARNKQATKAFNRCVAYRIKKYGA